MGTFVSGVLQGIRPLFDGDTLVYQWLDFHFDYGIEQAVFDSNVLTADLQVGQHYEVLLSPFPLLYSVEHLTEPEVWSAKIIAIDWPFPFSSFSAISSDLDPTYVPPPPTRVRHLDTTRAKRLGPPHYVLLEAPFGQLVTSSESIERKAGVPKDEIALGAFISWGKDTRINLAAVV